MNCLIIFSYSFSYVLLAFYILFIGKKKDYIYLLEKPNNYYFGKEEISSIDIKNSLLQTIHKFCQKNNIYDSGAIVSLSGGVDSMVVLAILIKLSKLYNFKIYACSLNYNLREEQSD